MTPRDTVLWGVRVNLSLGKDYLHRVWVVCVGDGMWQNADGPDNIWSFEGFVGEVRGVSHHILGLGSLPFTLHSWESIKTFILQSYLARHEPCQMAWNFDTEFSQRIWKANLLISLQCQSNLGGVSNSSENFSLEAMKIDQVQGVQGLPANFPWLSYTTFASGLFSMYVPPYTALNLANACNRKEVA